MTTYGANRNFASTGNPLCDKLKRQFAARGVANVPQYKAPSTSVMIARVQRGLDPYKNAPNPLTEKRSAPVQRTPEKKAALRSVPKRAPGTIVPATSQKHTAVPSAPIQRAQAPAAFSAESRQMRSAAAAARDKKAKTRYEEVRVARSPFPFAALITATIFTVILLAVMFAFVQNYELSGEISKLEAERDTLTRQEQILQLQLEQRDDIRVIEDIAVNKIGMVKNDLVENRFVSVSGGNRVELSAPLQEEEEENSNVFSGMLSAIGENFAKLREYID